MPREDTAMQAEQATTQPSRRLLPTGIAGPDEILDIGHSQSGLYLVVGDPGTGKTTLGNKLAYAHAARGKMGIYATVLTETHERTIVHLRGFDFFDPKAVAPRVHYVGLSDELSGEGRAGSTARPRRQVREHRAAVPVIDSASLFDDFARLRRILSIVKGRDAAHDIAIREFAIGPGGVQVGAIFAPADAVLSWVARSLQTLPVGLPPVSSVGGERR